MRLLCDREIYTEFTAPFLGAAEHLVWIATANIKSTGIHEKGRFVSFVDTMAALVKRGVNFRIIHSEIPSAPFRERYEQLDVDGSLSAGVEFLHCIRMHAKIFIVDGKIALIGSANLTGAGIGAKSSTRRNFELGILLENERETRPLISYFDHIWMGGPCPKCQRRELCPAPPV